MTLSEVVDRVISRVGGMEPADAREFWRFVQLIVEELVSTLEKGQDVKIYGLGRFYWRRVKAKTWTTNGKKVEVPSGWRLKFIPSVQLRRLKMTDKEDNGMTKLGVVTENEKTKVAGTGESVLKCPWCHKELDDAGACPEHGTEPFEPTLRK